MSDKEATQGLSCPNCGGAVPVPEGQVVVICPYCDLRSYVRGERGLQRYQAPVRISRLQSLEALRRFLSRNIAIAGDVAKKAVLEETFMVHLPFWATWTRLFGWVFGQKKVGSGDRSHYEPREVRSVQEMSWNGVACDVGEFGVAEITLDGRPMEAFNAENLHASGLVFEPVGSISDARSTAETSFSNRLRQSAKLDRIAQVFQRSIQERMGLVYYPLWVVRYLYRGRSFQVVVDGFSGEVLYGKAPGSTLYRAAMLIGGMALGALLAVDGSALAFSMAANSSSDDAGGIFIGGLLAIVFGFGIMLGAYRLFRYGEHYEFRRGGKSDLRKMVDFDSNLGGVMKWVKR